MPNELIDFWQECSLIAPPFAHPQDLPILREKGRWRVEDHSLDFDRYIASRRFGDGTDNRLHLSLLPLPYIGDLENAEIIILLLNPGFEYGNYWAEAKVPEFRKRLEQNLQQSFEGVEFPFLYFDPQFCWHNGFMWWEHKLRGVIQEIARRNFNGVYRNALLDLSTKLACVELIPYHSVSFKDQKLIKLLPSVQMARQFVHNAVAPNAKGKNPTLIVTRQAKTWDLASNKDIIVYEGGHTRGASLSTKSAGGKRILQRYGIV